MHNMGREVLKAILRYDPPSPDNIVRRKEPEKI